MPRALPLALVTAVAVIAVAGCSGSDATELRPVEETATWSGYRLTAAAGSTDPYLVLDNVSLCTENATRFRITGVTVQADQPVTVTGFGLRQENDPTFADEGGEVDDTARPGQDSTITPAAAATVSLESAPRGLKDEPTSWFNQGCNGNTSTARGDGATALTVELRASDMPVKVSGVRQQYFVDRSDERRTVTIPADVTVCAAAADC